MSVLSFAHTEELKLTREQEIEFNTNGASFYLAQMLKQEKAIAAIPETEIAVFSAAAGINRLIAAQKETGKLNQQQFAFVMSVVLVRLAILSQTANMPPAVTACHFAEARDLENVRQGQASSDAKHAELMPMVQIFKRMPSGRFLSHPGLQIMR